MKVLDVKVGEHHITIWYIVTETDPAELRVSVSTWE